jgi:hypothetical protein
VTKHEIDKGHFKVIFYVQNGLYFEEKKALLLSTNIYLRIYKTTMRKSKLFEKKTKLF